MFENYDIDVWKREYDEITKKVKFGGADAEMAYGELKVKINEAVNGYIRKAQKLGMAFPIALIATILLVIILISLDQEAACLYALLIGSAICVFLHKAKNGCWNAVEAAQKFDEVYFGGEIFYRRKHG